MIQSFKEAFAKSPIARKAPEIDAEDFINGKKKSFVINLDQPDINEKLLPPSDQPAYMR